MSDKVHPYSRPGMVVNYTLKRCIHAAECVRGLPQVFDPERRPWVTPEAAEPDRIAEVVTRCPTGALHFERTDGGPAEAPDDTHSIVVTERGPFYLRGELELRAADGTMTLHDTRVALCRCGASKNKPFCDNSHWNTPFFDLGLIPDPRVTADPDAANAGGAAASARGAGTLRVTGLANGPLQVEGRFELWSSDGETTVRGVKAALCRCGQSKNKPFCDSSHVTAGFRSE
jgi:CDGSH-type Zn-finger protein/uncharacterized Fe-S cluster protein YjdI